MMGSSRIVSGVVAPLVTVLGDLISIIVLLVTLIFASPEVTFTLVIILAMSQRIYFIWLRDRLSSYGQQALDKGAALNEEIIQSFQAVKEIKIYSLTEAINQHFTRERDVISLIGQRSSFLNNLFRYYLETIILFSAFFVVAFELSTSDLRRALTSLVLFMSVGLRIISSLQRLQAITMSLQQSQGMTKTYFDMREQLQNLAQEDIVSEDLIQHPPQVLGIEFKDLTYSVENYGAAQVILQEINFKINPDTFVCIIGESGSGKTTLVDLISGLLGTCQGKISYFDLSGGTFNPNRSYVGYCSQNPYIFDTSVEKNLLIAKKHIDKGKVNSLIDELNLKSLYESTQEANDVVLPRRISGGERLRIGIARVFLSERPILVFDEPTSALDKENALSFFEILNRNRQKRTQIAVTHDLELAKKSDLLFILDQGRLIYSGESEDYFANKK
jgi:ABC-type multidrug transport system fused ATPase/permease subunit